MTDPTLYADLHAHTTASDGTLTPAELVRAARTAGVGLLAVTDHDTTAGVAEARAEAARIGGVALLPGVELSAEGGPGGKCHLLGFGINPGDAALAGTLTRLSEARRTRNARMADRLTRLGLPVTLDEVTAAAPPGANVGRPHFAHVLAAKGYVRDLREAFDRYLGDDAPGYVAKETLTAGEAVALVHGAGGLCFLAHPVLLKLAEHETHETRVRDLAALGMDGIEAYYNKNTPAQTEKLLRLAEKLNLLVCGGSDFHGANKPDVALGGVLNEGTERLPASLLPGVLRAQAG